MIEQRHLTKSPQHVFLNLKLQLLILLTQNFLGGRELNFPEILFSFILYYVLLHFALLHEG